MLACGDDFVLGLVIGIFHVGIVGQDSDVFILRICLHNMEHLTAASRVVIKNYFRFLNAGRYHKVFFGYHIVISFG